MGDITYICKRTVVSTKPVEAGKYFPLPVLDHHMEKNHIRVLYYYPTSVEAELMREIIKNLKHSLSETLTFFPIMTGRLLRDEKGHWKVKCNDAGVRMVEAKAKGNIQDWLRNLNREKELQLVHWEDMSHKPYYWSTFYVQITEFEEGGLAIGLSCFHLLADPISVTMFMKAWSHISLHQNMIVPPLFHPLPSPRLGNKNPNLIHHYKSSIMKSPTITRASYTTITLGFSNQSLQACMVMAQTPSEPSPSPFEALAGLFWVVLSKIKGMRDGLVDFSICLDARKALGLDYGFFGNCMIYNKVHPDVVGNLEKNKLFPQAARAIREVVSKMDNEGIMDLIGWFEDDDDMNSPRMMDGHDVICTSIEEVDPYWKMFEGGDKPIRVSYYIEPVIGEGQILIFAAPPNEGPLSRIAMVTLREDEAIKFCEDDLILHLGPNISMKSV